MNLPIVTESSASSYISTIHSFSIFAKETPTIGFAQEQQTLLEPLCTSLLCVCDRDTIHKSFLGISLPSGNNFRRVHGIPCESSVNHIIKIMPWSSMGLMSSCPAIQHFFHYAYSIKGGQMSEPHLGRPPDGVC